MQTPCRCVLAPSACMLCTRVYAPRCLIKHEFLISLGSARRTSQLCSCLQYPDSMMQPVCAFEAPDCWLHAYMTDALRLGSRGAQDQGAACQQPQVHQEWPTWLQGPGPAQMATSSRHFLALPEQSTGITSTLLMRACALPCCLPAQITVLHFILNAPRLHACWGLCVHCDEICTV